MAGPLIFGPNPPGWLPAPPLGNTGPTYAPTLAPYVVQVNPGSAFTNTGASPPFAYPNQAGNAIIVVMICSASANVPTSATDTAGNVYRFIGYTSMRGTGNAASCCMLIAANIKAAKNNQITVTQSGRNFTFAAVEVANLASNGSVNAIGFVSASASQVNATPVSTAWPVTDPNAFVVAIVAKADSTPAKYTIPAGYLEIVQAGGGGASGPATTSGEACCKTVTAIGTATAAWTSNPNGSGSFSELIIAFDSAGFVAPGRLPLQQPLPGPGRSILVPPRDDTVLSGQSTYFGDEAETWFNECDNGEQYAAAAGFQQAENLNPVEDAWDYWTTDDDDHVDVSEFALIENLSPFEDAWDHFLTEDEDPLQLIIDDDDDAVGPDVVPPGIAAEDVWEHFTTDDDDHLVQEDRAALQGDAPIEDGWDHFVTDDDDQVDTIEFALISVAVTTLQYYGEDPELADVDQDDDEWLTRTGDVLGADVTPNPALCIEDAYDWSAHDEDDYAVSEDYQQVSVVVAPQYFGEEAEWTEDDAETPWTIDEVVSRPDELTTADAWDFFAADDEELIVLDEPPPAVPPQCPEDAYDWFAADEDEQWPLDEPQSAAVVNPLLCAEDAWDHFSTSDDDDYYVADDFQFPIFTVLNMAGVAFSGGTAVGTVVLVVPSGPFQYDPRFYNGSNAWLGYRTASGGGIF